jgi:hypothetical protein
MQQPDYSYIFVDLKNQVMEARLSCSCTSRGKLHFAECPELDLIDQGRSRREAVDNLTNMIVETLLAAIETGKFERMMKQLGFSRRTLLPYRTIFRQSLESMDDLIPLPLEISLRGPVVGLSQAMVG